MEFIKPEVQLFDNQKDNVRLLVRRGRALLCDRVGSGKTLSCLYSFAYLKEKGALRNALVFTPLSAYEKEVWKKDCDKFTRLRSISFDAFKELVGNRWDKLGEFLAQYPVIYCKHTMVKSSLDFLIQLVCQPGMLVILDEVHAFKNPKCDLTGCMKMMCNKAKFIWGITGSSISRDLEDFYNIVNLISPWYFGAFTKFRNDWCEVREEVCGRFNGKLRKCLVIVGLRKDRLDAFQRFIEPLVVQGESFFTLHFHWLDYQLDDDEQNLYRRIARGIACKPDIAPDDWLGYILSNDVEEVPRIKDVDAFSSRFIYLQSVVDGVLNADGTLTKAEGTKLRLLLDTLRGIFDKGQSAIVYFDYLVQVRTVERLLKESGMRCKVLLSTGDNVLDGSAISEGACKQIPHVILGTRASSESVSYYFINNVIFFNIPTVTHTFVQLVGRITRKNSLYPDDLNVYMFRSDNIDLYKMLMLSSKAAQLEAVQGYEGNIPDDYKKIMSNAEMKDVAKRTLLWQTSKAKVIKPSEDPGLFG